MLNRDCPAKGAQVEAGEMVAQIVRMAQRLAAMEVGESLVTRVIRKSLFSRVGEAVDTVESVLRRAVMEAVAALAAVQFA